MIAALIRSSAMSLEAMTESDLLLEVAVPKPAARAARMGPPFSVPASNNSSTKRRRRSRLWDERAVSSGAYGSQTLLGRRYPTAPQGVPCRCADDLAGCPARPSPVQARSGRSVDRSPRHADHRQMAEHRLAHWH